MFLFPTFSLSVSLYLLPSLMKFRLYLLLFRFPAWMCSSSSYFKCFIVPCYHILHRNTYIYKRSHTCTYIDSRHEETVESFSGLLLWIEKGTYQHQRRRIGHISSHWSFYAPFCLCIQYYMLIVKRLVISDTLLASPVYFAPRWAPAGGKQSKI